MNKPNFLILMSDQHNPRFLGCAGHPFIRTPHLDSLAQRGVQFQSAYCPAPLCGPSRMSFLSGLFPCRTGIHANAQALPSDIPTFAHALAAAGYRTALAGRMHIVGPDQAHGFDEKLGKDVTPSSLGGGIHPRLHGLHAGGTPEGLILSGPGDSAYHHYDDDVTSLASQWLRNRSPSQPFCLTVGFALPHDPFVCSPADYALYESLAAPPPLPSPDEPHPRVLQKRLAIRDARVTNADQARALAAYCGSITATDRRIGRLLAALRDIGADSNTIVIYTSDHGEMAGEHGVWYKTLFYEASARIPLLIAAPDGLLPRNQVRASCVNLVDLTATILDYAGAAPLPLIDGRSLRPLLRNPVGPWDDQTFSEYGTRFKTAILARMIRRGPWKYSWHQDLPDELFNLADDPGECRNLAHSPECRSVKAELSDRLFQDWDPAAVNRQMDLWKQRNSALYAAYRARDPLDLELFEGPPGCNRLDRNPAFVPNPAVTRGMY